MRKVEVVPYNERWSELFEQEAAKLKLIYGDETLHIHHIGSTSVPGLYAKPIIDIMIVVKDIQKVDAFNPQMEFLGYRPRGENGIPHRRYFNKGDDDRTHHIHIFQFGCEHIIRHLAFRDYLIAYPEEANTYSDLKIRLAKKFPTNISGYIDGKDSLAKELERRAVQWYSQQ
jgi:GrpB-like predicted nucleotidyltransferase (UPF0157 family)